MEKKTLLRLLVILLLGLSWVVYAVAVPATRSSKMSKMDSPVVQDQLVKEELFYINMEGGDESLEGRMMMEIEDYPGTRANPAHDPKSPGKP